MSGSNPLTFESFQALLADLLHIEPALLRPDAYFITDLNVDSLSLLGLLLNLERMGVRSSLESVWRMQTVGDAYAYCREYLSD
jgi:acyl carrier protein